MKHYHRIPLMLCSFCAVSLSIIAQNNTNLPTSMYGVGELSTSDGGRYAGMGNIGIALNRTGFQNTLNPNGQHLLHIRCRCIGFICPLFLSE